MPTSCSRSSRRRRPTSPPTPRGSSARSGSPASPPRSRDRRARRRRRCARPIRGWRSTVEERGAGCFVALARGDVDIAISMASRQAPVGPALPAARAARRHARRRPPRRLIRWRGDDEIALAALAGEAFVGPPDGTSCHDVTVTGCAAAGFAPSFKHRTLDYHAAMALVAAGLGVDARAAARPGGGPSRRRRAPARGSGPGPARLRRDARRRRAPPGGRGGARGAQPRISASTSSRLPPCPRARPGLEAQAQQRLGVRGAHVEVPVVVVDRDAVELGDLAVGVALSISRDLRLLVGDLGVDLAGDEVLRAVAARAARPSSAPAEQLEDQQRGQRPGVGAVEVAEVVVAGDLAAEDARPRRASGS